jgi:alpha-galactosidase
MWSALKSPLIISTDLRDLTAPALTILNNPAVIAINQDPLSRPAVQIRRDLNVKKDQYGVGEAQVWSGHLAGGDQVVVFFNAADEDLNMEASLTEIFYHEGPNGHAPQVKEVWEIYDLWGDRMEDSVAQKILDAPTPSKANKLFEAAGWYNSTAVPYKQGLNYRDPRLLGKKVGTIVPGGLLKAKVKRHSAEMFRLISENGKNLKRYNYVKDEL